MTSLLNELLLGVLNEERPGTAEHEGAPTDIRLDTAHNRINDPCSPE